MSQDVLSRTSMMGNPSSEGLPTRSMDFMLLFLLSSLVGIGLVSIYSASVSFSNGTGGVFYLQRQLMATTLGIFLMVMAMNLPQHAVRWFARWSVVGALFLLILVFVPGIGHKAGGATRWIGKAGFYFQPAEFTKVAFILFVADFVHRRPNVFRGSFIQQWPVLVMLFIMSIVLYRQPDNGTIMVVCGVIICMMILAGMQTKVWLPIVSIALIGGFLLYWSTPYVQDRFDAFLYPLKDPRGKSWQLINALIALGRGGWSGVGLGDSIQKTGYLPEVHTDFIFSMIGEEVGFIGTVILISLFALLVQRLFTLGRLANMRGDLFGAMYIYGVALWIGIQASINILVNTGWFPTKGLTLPFISYGSSSIMMLGLAMGFVFNIQRHTRLNGIIYDTTSNPPLATNSARKAN